MGLPSFFKVLVGDFESTLRIPRLFVVKFEDIFPDDALLQTKSGESWSVKIEKIGDRYCFTHGWPQFVKEHQLRVCDFLVFWPMLERKPTFRVSMYGPSGCEKELTLRTISNVPSPDKTVIDLESTGSPCTTSPNIKQGKFLRYALRPSTTTGAERKSTSIDKYESGSNGAKLSDDPVKEMNPRFVTVFKSHNKCRQVIPIKFARENGIVEKKNLRLINSEGQTWPVSLILRPKNRTLEIVRGWAEFWKNNGLTVGRRCVFEFITGTDCFRVRVLEGGH